VAPPSEVDGGAAAPQEPPSGPTSEYASPQQAPEPDSVVVTLRLPEDESATGAEVTARVEAGGGTSMIALVRNQSGIVDNYDLHVEGLPDGWWSIVPSTVYLVPYGAPGGEYEQEVTVTLTPPRTTEAVAGTWPIRLVAVSKANGLPAGQATAALEITPYHELEAEMRPAQATGRRKAAFAIAVRNRANAPVDVQLGAVDPDNVMRFAFQKPRFTVEPGRRNGSGIMVKPPKPAWVGRPVQRRFDITSTVIGSDTGALPKSAVLVQKAWIPFWALILLPLLLIAAIAGYLLWPRTSTVPDLKGKEIIAAEQALADAGLTLGNQTQKPTDDAKSGTVLGQSPAAGEKADDGSAVSIEVAVATGRAKVPNVIGKTLAEASKILSEAGFTLAPPETPPVNPDKDTIGQQVPLPDTVESKTTPVTVVFNPPEAPGTGKNGGKKNGGKTGTDGAPPVIVAGKIEVPDFDGVPASKAVEQLTKLGLTPKLTEEFSPDAKDGELVHQDPEHGTKVGKGSEVKLVYSKGYPQLVFDQNGDIFLIGGDGKNQKPLVKSADVEEHASFSPIGGLVAYRRGTADTGRIWVIDPADPQSARPVSDDGFDDRRPAISPDGKVIAFVRGKTRDADHDLCFVPVAGGKPACVAEPTQDVSRPTWSPDGRAILVVAAQTAEQQVELLQYKSAVPSSPKAVDWFAEGLITDAMHGKKAGEFVVAAAWSPDGKQVALTANWGSPAVVLFLAGSKDNVLAKAKPVAGVSACELSWRPDGKELAISRRGGLCDAAGDIARVDPANPSEQVTLTKTGSGNPSWSPLGSK
jgi:beta-lactam-binding protein with PASTA domain